MGIPYAEVIGDPVDHSKSPLIHNFWLRKLGLEGDYRATRVAPEGLADYFESRLSDPDWRGCNITMPHKHSVSRLLSPSPGGGPVPAINCAVREHDRMALHNFDIHALVETVPATEGRIVILGNGGAACAALDALRNRPLAVVARDPSKARELCETSGGQVRIFPIEEAERALSGAAGLINATPLGMDHAPEMPGFVLDAVHRLRPDGFVYDMVYAPSPSPLVRTAREAGLHAIDGLTMLTAQARFAFQRFFGLAAPPDHDLELRELLVR